ncbi:MAG TPA: hypothetical protein VFQ37_12595 [Mycobacterium sp.]|nr:hypothetical protein [Mycobacterium sp.]
MKLARPDIFHPRIVLAGDPQRIEGDTDDAGLVAALDNRGLHVRWLSWDDPETLRADLVILRGTRDYLTRHEEFLAWTRQVPNLLNPADVVAWNADPRYLRDLQYAGVPTLPRHPPGEATALVFFGGGRSHAFGAAGTELDSEPDFELWDLGRTALRAAAERMSIRIEELLYARADVVGSPGDVRLAGLDLIAPQLGWRELGAVERDRRQRQFVLCVESALQRLGLGPLSHRRP